MYLIRLCTDAMSLSPRDAERGRALRAGVLGEARRASLRAGVHLLAQRAQAVRVAAAWISRRLNIDQLKSMVRFNINTKVENKAVF